MISSLLLFLVFAASVSANETDLIRGKLASRQDPAVSNAYVPNHPATANITDNDRATYDNVQRNVRLRYVFDEPQIVSSFYVYISYASQYTYAEYWVALYNEAGTRLRQFNLLGELPNTVTNFPPISNVKRVEIQLPNPFTVRLNSFEVYGYPDVYSPTDLTLTPDSRSVVLRWQGVPTNGTGFQHYNIYRDGVRIATTTNEQFRVTNLSADVDHSYYVNAQYANTMSLNTNTVVGAAYDNPLRAIVPTAKVTEDSVRLSWQSNNAVLYNLYVNDELLYSGTDLNFDHLNLPTYETFTYRVDSIDKYERVVTGSNVSYRTQPPPNPLPLNVAATKLTYHSATITFTKRIAPYTMTFNGNVTTHNENSILLTDLEPLSSYTVQLSYVDEYDRLVQEEITFTTLDLPRAVPPELTVTNIKVDNARLSWSRVGESYELYLNGQKLLEQSTYFYTLSSLTENTTYTAKVIAIDAFGRRTESNTVTFTTLNRPPPKPPPTPPPKVSDSGNVKLDEANDHLVAGGNDLKKNSMILIWIFIAIFIMVFGAIWLMKLFKKKMTKASVTNAARSSRTSTTSNSRNSNSSNAGGNTQPLKASYKNSSVSNRQPRRYANQPKNHYRRRMNNAKKRYS